MRLIRWTGALAVAALSVLLIPAPASACAVSYEDKPAFTLRLGGNDFGLRAATCSNGTSITAVILLTLLAAAVAVALASRIYQATEASLTASGESPDATLSTYLSATGLESPPQPPPTYPPPTQQP